MELPVDAGQVITDRFLADPEAGRDDAGRLGPSDHHKDVPFSMRKLADLTLYVRLRLDREAF